MTTTRDRAEAHEVTIRAFGRFEVLRSGRPVPASAWRSRKARELLRVLVSRRGRVVPRAELCELLWPDDDPLRTSHRLSVLLSIVRAATGVPDILVADAACVALDLTRVHVDVEHFLSEVARGLQQARCAAPGARAVLVGALGRWTGEPFEDDPYAEWATSLREEARAARLRALRVVADVAAVAGDREQAAACLRRLLTIDPYDEPAHRALVACLADGGQHGEARRAFGRFRTAMAAIGVRPPDPRILGGRTSHGPDQALAG